MKFLLLIGILFAQATIDDNELEFDNPRALPFICRDRSNIDIISIVISQDVDGDRWVKIRDKKTKEIELGFINHRNGKFCRITTAKI